MKMKSFLIKLINVLCICVILFVYQGYAAERQEKIEEMEQAAALEAAAIAENEAEAAVPYEDGTYTGSAQGFGGIVEVEVVIEKGVIVSARATNAKDETPDYFEQAEAIFDEVVKKQSADVDIVTGATYSSNGIIGGIQEALKKAEKQ